MDKLRVGGPCVWGKSRWIFGGNGFLYDGNGNALGPLDHQEKISPAPFIPGDVVEHRDRPGLRELVDDAGKIGIRTHGQDGETRFYCYSSVAAEKHGEGYTADLTLILPAQPAKEARDEKP